MSERRSAFGVHVVLVASSLAMVAPFVWQLITSLKTLSSATAVPPTFLPEGRWDNYTKVFDLLPFGEQFLNTVLMAAGRVSGQVLFCSMAAYAFARLRWRGREAVFGLFLAGLMVPAIFTLLPNFVLVKQLGLVDNLLGVALPTMFMTPFAVFFLRQFFMNVPREVEEAALLDGAGKVRIFFRLMLPMASTPLLTLGLLTYITAWNDYFWPLMVSYSDSSRVLTVALAIFRAQTPQTGYDWSGLMAATLIAALPMLVLFGCFARRIVGSISFTGIK